MARVTQADDLEALLKSGRKVLSSLDLEEMASVYARVRQAWIPPETWAEEWAERHPGDDEEPPEFPAVMRKLGKLEIALRLRIAEAERERALLKLAEVSFDGLETARAGAETLVSSHSELRHTPPRQWSGHPAVAPICEFLDHGGGADDVFLAAWLRWTNGEGPIIDYMDMRSSRVMVIDNFAPS